MDMTTGSWSTRLWQRTTLMQRLAFVALVPTLITAILLVTLLTQRQVVNLRQMAHDNADAIATQAASLCLLPLRTTQLRELERIADSIGALPHVTHVQIRSTAGQILASHDGSDPSRDPRETLTVMRNVVDLDEPGHPVVGSVLVDVSLHQAVAAQRASLRHAFVALLLSLFVAGVIGWQAARWISAPLRHLAGAVRQLGKGDRRVAVVLTDRTEIGELQRGFNHAAATLYDAQRSMEEQIEQATQELARKNAALEAVSVTRARFLAAASHDLRQPLYALTLFSSSLAVGEHDSQRLDRIAHIQECVQSLDHLFSELLDLSRLETGAVQVEIDDFPLERIFAEVSRNFGLLAEQRGLKLAVHSTRRWVRVDRTVLTRILNNLVSNALHFTHHGGALLGVRRAGDKYLRIEVWDTGSGIASEHLPNVFDEFYRIDDQLDARPDHAARSGLGLGLVTAQRLAELLGTRIEVKSRPHRGSVFHFLLPATPANPRLPDEDNDVPADLAGTRVLVLDSDPAILSGIRFLLRNWDCDVEVAEDRLQAMEAIENWPGPPDIVISDLNLRMGERGLEVFAALDLHYQRDGCAPFARLLVTGETRIEHLRDIIAAKIPLLYKPISPQQLRKAMESALAVARGNG